MRALDERPVNDDVVALLTVFEPQIGELWSPRISSSPALCTVPVPACLKPDADGALWK